MSPRRVSRSRRLCIMLLCIGLVLLFGVAAVELGMRAFGEVTDVSFVFWDPVVGPRMAPNQSGRYKVGNDVHGRYRFNAQGWNHPEDYVVSRRPGVRRVCLVGDSQVESLQVFPADTMYAVAERTMNEAGVPAQWYAFGVSGYGTAQEYEVIRHYALEYGPDVVIMLFVQNDPYDTSPYIVDLPPHVVRYVLDDHGELVKFLPSEWRPIWWRRVGAQFALVRYFAIQRLIQNRLRYGKIVRGVGSLPLREDVSDFRNPLVPGLAKMPMAERQARTWELVEKLLAAARDECRARGALFAVAFRGWADEIDDPVQPEDPSRPPPDRDPYCLSVRAREMGREWVGPICVRLQIPYLDLTDPLRAAVSRAGRSHRYPDDNHYSELGHAAAGRAMAEWVVRMLSGEVIQVGGK